MEMPDQTQVEIDHLIENGYWEALADHFRANPDDVSKPSLHRFVESNKTRLHRLVTIDQVPVSLIELVASLYPQAVIMRDTDFHAEAIPLHRVCNDVDKLKALLTNCEDPKQAVLVSDKYGQTALHYACIHDAPLEVIKMLVETNQDILNTKTRNGFHAIRVLWDCYIAKKPAFTLVNRILEEDEIEVDEDHFWRFWEKMEYLSAKAFELSPKCPQNVLDINLYVLHGLLYADCHVDLMMRICCKMQPSLLFTADVNGNLPLHELLQKRRSRKRFLHIIQAFLKGFPEAAMVRNFVDDFPLMIAIRNHVPLEGGLEELLDASPMVVRCRDPFTGLHPFQLAAHVGGERVVESTYVLLWTYPELVTLYRD